MACHGIDRGRHPVRAAPDTEIAGLLRCCHSATGPGHRILRNACAGPRRCRHLWNHRVLREPANTGDCDPHCAGGPAGQCVRHGARPGTPPHCSRHFVRRSHCTTGWPGARWIDLRCERVRSANARMRCSVDHCSGPGSQLPAGSPRGRNGSDGGSAGRLSRQINSCCT